MALAFLRWVPLVAIVACSTSDPMPAAGTCDASTCSRESDGACVPADEHGKTWCDVDHGPSATQPDAAYVLACGPGTICGIAHHAKSFSCCAPSCDCVSGF